MVYLGNTREKTMYFGASQDIILRAKELRKNMTEAEKLLWEKLRSKKVKNTRFYRQHPIDIFVVDFYCHKYKLIIELDGEIHKSPDVRERDANRTAEMEKYGLKIIRFKNEEVYTDINTVVEKIKKAMK